MKPPLFDRELSWIEFNGRVLAEAMDETNPALERLKFLGIVSSNFDEFFMVRVASLSPRDPILKETYLRAFQLAEKQQKYFSEVLVPQLEKSGIRRVASQALLDSQRDYLKNLFQREIYPLLTPIAIRDDVPLPAIPNLSLYRMFALAEPGKPQEKKYAIIEIPKKYSRMITLPSEQSYSFVLLEDVVALFASEIFPGYEVVESALFRITRAAEFTLDEEKDEDFAKQMSEALAMRQRGAIVRLEFFGADNLLKRIKAELEIPDAKVIPQVAWFDLARIAQLSYQSIFPELKRPKWDPKPCSEIDDAENIFKLLQEKDLLLIQPYDSFDAFLKFLAAAVRDPDVLAIKQTLYRVGESSRVIHLLEEAAESGKQVTALLELKARFDEERNIEGSERLLRAGATVLYGVTGLKTHAKITLVVRREPEGIRRYIHLSTGNYNEKTAQLYSDFSFFSAKPELGQDASAFFNLITGYSQPVGFQRFEIAPFNLRQKVIQLITREAMRSTKEEPGLIMAKMNSLVDPDVIDALCKASQKGVKIRLNVRGVCCLKPGVKGLSENIEVVSIVDMFLEHARVFYFSNGGNEELYLSSADWMPRNFDRRMEIMWPLQDEKVRKSVLEILKMYFKDNQKAWVLQADGTYQKKDPGSEKKFRVQEQLCRRSAEQGQGSAEIKEIKPQKPKLDIRTAPKNSTS